MILEFENVPGFGSGELRLAIDPGPLGEDSILRLRRTFESRGRSNLRRLPLLAWPLDTLGDMRSATSPCEEAARITWWVRTGAGWKSQGGHGERI